MADFGDGFPVQGLVTPRQGQRHDNSSGDEAKAMLAGQMVAVQSITMDLLHEIGASGNRLQLNDAGNLV